MVTEVATGKTSRLSKKGRQSVMLFTLPRTPLYKKIFSPGDGSPDCALQKGSEEKFRSTSESQDTQLERIYVILRVR